MSSPSPSPSSDPSRGSQGSSPNDASGGPRGGASDGEDGDAYWRRPDPGVEAGRPESPSAPPAEPEYAGPPQVPPPPGTWHPPVISRPPEPRTMPLQDTDALDEAEGSARTVTYGVGLVAGAIAVILMCLLCARVLF